VNWPGTRISLLLIVADLGNGDKLSPDSATESWKAYAYVRAEDAEYSGRQSLRQSPFSATVAKFGDCSRQCGQGLTVHVNRHHHHHSVRFTWWCKRTQSATWIR